MKMKSFGLKDSKAKGNTILCSVADGSVFISDTVAVVSLGPINTKPLNPKR